MEVCANCNRAIGNLETPFVYMDNIVCGECNSRLSHARNVGTGSDSPATTGMSNPTSRSQQPQNISQKTANMTQELLQEFISSDPLTVIRAPIIAGLHRQRFAIVVLAGIGMLATFMPWLHAPIVGTISGASGDGWITLALFIPAIVLSLRGKKLKPLIGMARWAATIPAGISVLIGLGDIVNLKSSMADASKDNPFAGAIAASVQIGFGLYLLIMAGIAVVVAAWLLANYPREIEPVEK
jgi:hypothetical protein